MIFTLDVKNVKEAEMVKATMTEEAFGFSLKFSSVGAGFVSFNYGFYCCLVVDGCRLSKDPADYVEVEVWDNNVIVKMSLPAGVDFDQYKVGSSPGDLTIHSVPQLRALRKRREQLLSKVRQNNAQKPYHFLPAAAAVGNKKNLL